MKNLLLFDKLIKKYGFEDINQAFDDSAEGTTNKSVLVIDEDYHFEEKIEIATRRMCNNMRLLSL